MREFRAAAGWPWITLQYVAIPGANMDDGHVDALVRGLAPLRVILTVIPWNETGAGYRAPDWGAVKEFTTKHRRFGRPIRSATPAASSNGWAAGSFPAKRSRHRSAAGTCAPHRETSRTERGRPGCPQRTRGR